MHYRFTIAAGLLTAAISSLPAHAGEATILGRVVGADGQPVAGAQVATFWTFDDGELSAYDGVDVEADGAFSAKITFRGSSPKTIVAYAAGGDLAGAVSVTEDQDGPVVITLEPSIHVHLEITCSALGGDPGWLNTYWTYEKGRAVMARAEEGVIDLKLPRGEWAYYIYGSDIDRKLGSTELDGTKARHDMGVLDLPATFIALNRGRTIDDWHVTDARGVPIDKAQVKHYKGKWLLVEFWGYW
jgi:hypothetical protein